MIPTNLDLFSKVALSLGIALFGLVWLFHFLGCLKAIYYYFRWLRSLPRLQCAMLVLAKLCIPFGIFLPASFHTDYGVLEVLLGLIFGLTMTGLFFGGMYHGVLMGAHTVKRVLRFRQWQKCLLLALPMDLWVFWLMRG